MTFFFVAGLDLGQQRDHTALAIVHVTPTPCAQGVLVEDLDPDYGRPRERAVAIDGPPARLALRWLERYPLGTPYPAIVGAVTARLRAVPGPALLAVDATGVGRPVVDLFGAGAVPTVPTVAITLTAGAAARGQGAEWHVPKRDVVLGLLVALQQGRFRYAARLPLAPTLVQELGSVELRVAPGPGAAHDAYAAWRHGQHDDLVLAVALAVWLAEREVEARARAARAALRWHAGLSAPLDEISPF